MSISRSIDLSPLKGGKRQKDVLNAKDEKISIAVLRKVPLEPIPSRATILVLQTQLPAGTRLPFPESVPTFYGRCYEMTCMLFYFRTCTEMTHSLTDVRCSEMWEDYMGEYRASLLETKSQFYL